MTDESTRTPAHEEIAAAVRAEIARLVPGSPLPGAAAAAPAPRARCGTPRVADNNGSNGQWLALKSQVDDLKGNYAEIKRDMDTSFAALRGEMAEQARTTNERLDSIVTAISDKSGSGLDTFIKVGGVVLVLASGIGTLVKMNIDANVADAQNRISTVDRNLSERLNGITGTLKELTGPSGVIMRPELDNRINENHKNVETALTAIRILGQDFAALKADVGNLIRENERTKNDIVSRAENQTHWNDYENRLSAILTRLAELQKESGGGSMIEQLRQLREQVNDFQRKFIAIPAYPKLTPYGTDDGGQRAPR